MTLSSKIFSFLCLSICFGAFFVVVPVQTLTGVGDTYSANEAIPEITAAYRMDASGQVTRLPRPRLRDGVLLLPDDTVPEDGEAAIWTPATLEILWILQSPANRTEIKRRLVTALAAFRSAVSNIRQSRHFQDTYEQRLRVLIARASKKSLPEAATPYRLDGIVRALEEAFVDDFMDQFVGRIAWEFFQEMKDNLFRWLRDRQSKRRTTERETTILQRAVSAALADPTVRKNLLERLRVFLGKTAVQDLAGAFVVSFTENMFADREVEALLMEILDDPGFHDTITRASSVIQAEGRAIFKTLVTVDGSSEALHPLAGEVVQALVFGERRGLVLVIPETAWNAFPQEKRARLRRLLPVEHDRGGHDQG